jgi:hypothetical protein
MCGHEGKTEKDPRVEFLCITDFLHLESEVMFDFFLIWTFSEWSSNEMHSR